jgi:hypothetical protein
MTNIFVLPLLATAILKFFSGGTGVGCGISLERNIQYWEQ